MIKPPKISTLGHLSLLINIYFSYEKISREEKFYEDLIININNFQGLTLFNLKNLLMGWTGCDMETAVEVT